MSEIIFILLGVFAVLVIAVKIYALFEHGKAFRGVHIQQPCMGFISGLFEISEDECFRVSFDGRNFVHGREVSPTQYQHVSYAGYEVTEVFDDRIPHIDKYEYCNVDGSPDLRVPSSKNPKKMESKMHTFLFSGESQYKAKFFDLRYSFELECHETEKKFNNLLLGLSDEELKSHFDDFVGLEESRVELQEKRESLLKQNEEYLSIMAHFQDLQLTEKPSQENIQLKKEVSEKYKENLNMLNKLETEMEGLKVKENKLISSSKIRLSSLIAKEALNKYGDSFKYTS